MSYKVILLPRAESDLDSILNYIHQRSPRGARTWNERFGRVLDSLREDPTIFGAAPEDSRYGDWFIQQIIFSTRRGNPYRLLFIVRKQTVNVVYIRGYGKDLVADLDDIQLP